MAWPENHTPLRRVPQTSAEARYPVAIEATWGVRLEEFSTHVRDTLGASWLENPASVVRTLEEMRVSNVPT
jgi:hypothetical protein